MALAAMETAPVFSIISSYPSSSSSPSPKFHSFNRPTSFSSLQFHLRNPLLFTPQPIQKPSIFHLHTALEETVVIPEEEQNVEIPQNAENKRKLFVLNLPWSFSVVDIKNLFGQCGPVADVEIIKQKNGKSRGFAFVTMESGEGAQAAIEKYDSFEVSGRIVKVQFAKRLKKPRPAAAVSPTQGETRHTLYVSNLAWKVRSNNLREFFSSDSNPVTARVVFDSPTGKSAGYGFVSFTTREEAESAISTFDGKELLGRPIRLKLNEKSNDAPEIKEVPTPTPSEQLPEDS